ncbi:hypothetical protein MED121_02110 [Marinomonas sp. MED121]|uniref:hypothetical protein n=1 Tax=Marinomonas sp. MED121 TaxID=314277 RepID=UPI0000690B2B|nr:hypothetical protein [Marinomonas sp. MED121]EAQ65967.1 hypothetical protein MED121_02110 [Marinomonas sp. MED121]
MLPVLTGLASLAVELGPAAIRGVAHLFGGSDTAEKVASAVEKTDAVLGMSLGQQETVVARELRNLPPESLVELEQLKVELEKEKTKREELYLQDQQAEHHETQTTIRAGDIAHDEYVRRTRPLGCRISLYFALGYIFLFEGLAAIDKGTGANWELASMMIAPFMTYLGWRALDKKGATKGTGSMVGDTTATLGSLVKGRH